MMELPDFWPVGVRCIKKPRGFKLKKHIQSSQYPPIQKLGEFLVIDWWKEYKKISKFMYRHLPIPYDMLFGNYNGHYVLKIWKKEDHPNLKLLPPNTPRTVKRLYLAEVQLSILRNAITLELYDVWEAWRKFQLNLNRGNNEMDNETSKDVRSEAAQQDYISPQMAEANAKETEEVSTKEEFVCVQDADVIGSEYLDIASGFAIPTNIGSQ